LGPDFVEVNNWDKGLITMKKIVDENGLEVDLMTTSEISRMFKISRSKIYEMIEQYNIPSFRVGKKIMLNANDWTSRVFGGQYQIQEDDDKSNS